MAILFHLPKVYINIPCADQIQRETFQKGDFACGILMFSWAFKSLPKAIVFNTHRLCLAFYIFDSLHIYSNCFRIILTLTMIKSAKYCIFQNIYNDVAEDSWSPARILHSCWDTNTLQTTEGARGTACSWTMQWETQREVLWNLAGS